MIVRALLGNNLKYFVTRPGQENHPGVKLGLDLVDFQVYIKSINGAGKRARVVLNLDLI